MAYLQQHGERRGASADGQLLRYTSGRPITSRPRHHPANRRASDVMNVEPVRHATTPVTDALALAADLPLTEDEAGYVEAARAPNTLRGCRSDWAEFLT